MKKIIVAKPHGFCFGVSRAIKIAQDSAKKYQKPIYLLGELVHNQHVIDWLQQELKIIIVSSIDQIPSGSVVIIRAHGASPQVFFEAQKKQLTIVDATCPIVIQSHQIVKDLIQKNQKVIFLCSSLSHDETIGIVGESPKSIIPLTLTDAIDYKIIDPQNYTVLTQTTLSAIETKTVIDKLKIKYPQLNILPHICQATTERQQVIINFAKKNNLIIVVGSTTSANSNNLCQVAMSLGATAYIVDNATELKSEWFNNQKDIVISSGASTPESVLNQVVDQIKILTHP